MRLANSNEVGQSIKVSNRLTPSFQPSEGNLIALDIMSVRNLILIW